MPLKYAVPLLEFGERNHLSAAVYTDEKFYRLKESQIYMADMTGPGWAEIEHFEDVLSSAPTFIRFLGAEAVAAVREKFGDMPLAFKHESWGTFEELAITSREATKQHALAELCRTYAIPAKRVMAVGDSRNDVPMMQWAGLGVAMGNALPEVRDAVSTTAGSDDDGVAGRRSNGTCSRATRKSADAVSTNPDYDADLRAILGERRRPTPARVLADRKPDTGRRLRPGRPLLGRVAPTS